MPKPYAKLGSFDYEMLRKLAESGMGYYLLRGKLDRGQYDRTLIIAGDRIVPATDNEFVSVEDLWKREPFPSLTRGGVSLRDLQVATSPLGLPAGYLASTGAVPLLGSVTLSVPAKFYRFMMAATDHRFALGMLAPGTYLTTALDQKFVNTGFGAVGRYALPIPVPALYVFEYELPTGSLLQVGTVQPNFGQSGGGVEVKTVSSLTAKQLTLPNMAEY
jgi:hypothetical protein